MTYLKVMFDRCLKCNQLQKFHYLHMTKRRMKGRLVRCGAYQCGVCGSPADYTEIREWNSTIAKLNYLRIQG